MVLCLASYVFYLIEQSQKSYFTHLSKTWLLHIISRSYFTRALHILLLASLPGNTFPQLNTALLILFYLMFPSPSFYVALLNIKHLFAWF